MRAAEGLPVFFHFNAASNELRQLYRSAAIYWHATGYGFDADKYPSKQEHFGISTVEAMSAGAVPVIYATGGQKEIVTDEVDGYWWTDIDRLVNQTRRLANDAALRSELGHQAVLSSKRFSRETFVANRSIDRLGFALKTGTCVDTVSTTCGSGWVRSLYPLSLLLSRY